MTPPFPGRILLVGSGATGSLESAYHRALRRLLPGSVDFLDISNGRWERPGSDIVTRGLNRVLLSPFSRHKAGELLFKHLSAKSYEFIIIFKGSDFSRPVLERCRAKSARAVWVNVNPDDPLNVSSRGSTNRYIIESIRFFDLYLTWSPTVLGKIVGAGCRKGALLPFGYDSDYHVPPVPEVPRRGFEISFVGAWDRQREELLTGISDLPLRIYGLGWDRVPRRSPLRDKVVSRNIYRDELAAVISGTAVSLNLLRPQNKDSHNMRTFEIPAMGGLMLTTRTREQHAFFPEDEASLMYQDVAELREKLAAIFADPDRAHRIRNRGLELAHGNSYDDRAGRLLAELLSAALVWKA